MFHVLSLFLALHTYTQYSAGGKLECYWDAQLGHKWPLAAESTGRRLHSDVFFLRTFYWCISVFYAAVGTCPSNEHQNWRAAKYWSTLLAYFIQGKFFSYTFNRKHIWEIWCQKLIWEFLITFSCWFFVVIFQVQISVSSSSDQSLKPEGLCPFVNKPNNSNKTFWAECSTH